MLSSSSLNRATHARRSALQLLNKFMETACPRRTGVLSPMPTRRCWRLRSSFYASRLSENHVARSAITEAYHKYEYLRTYIVHCELIASGTLRAFNTIVDGSILIYENYSTIPISRALLSRSSSVSPWFSSLSHSFPSWNVSANRYARPQSNSGRDVNWLRLTLRLRYRFFFVLSAGLSPRRYGVLCM